LAKVVKLAFYNRATCMNYFILIPLGIILLILGLIAIASIYDIPGTKWYSRLYWYYYRLFFGKKYKDASASFIYGIILILVGAGSIVLYFQLRM